MNFQLHHIYLVSRHWLTFRNHCFYIRNETGRSGPCIRLVNTGYQIGSAIELAVVVVIATMTTANLTASGTEAIESTNIGFQPRLCELLSLQVLSTVLAMLFVKTPKK